jgi:3-phosphoshikimate 1-carboxyvinyltransferase
MKLDSANRSFVFRIPASKSELIRALLLQSFEPSLVIVGDSRCEDVENVRRALRVLAQDQESTRLDHRSGGSEQATRNAEIALDLGGSGLGFRCLALRASRLGRQAPVLLSGSRRLLSRPHAELWSALRELGCEVRDSGRGAELVPPSQGQWTTQRLVIRGGESSQFASAILLSSIGLQRDFTLVVEEPLRSRGYLDLTIRFLHQVGIACVQSKRSDRTEIRVPAGSVPRPHATVSCEGDWSTAASLLAVAAARPGTRIELEGLSRDSVQPDRMVLDWLAQMGVPTLWKEADESRVDQQEVRLVLERSSAPLSGIRVSGERAPDLIPVFAALASRACGRSEVHSAPQLRYKESDRIRLAVRLAQFLGARAEETPDGFWVEPTEAPLPFRGSWSTDQDHRQVMAAFVALASGADFSIDDVSVVAKSAPEFLQWMEQLSLHPKASSWIFIGHRGTGKTALARRLARRLGTEVVDLDEEIEKVTGRRVSEIFEKQGEADFRAIEREQLKKWVARELRAPGRIIVAGAGLDPEMDPRQWRDWLVGTGYEVAWISRHTDAEGRIFLDRPRLDRELGPLKEYRNRAISRVGRYRDLSSRRVILREGADRHELASQEEIDLLAGIPALEGASITVPAWAFADHSRLGEWLSVRRGWPFRFFEIREDFLPQGLTSGQASKALRELEFIPGDRLLFSRRLPDPDDPLRSFAAVLRARGSRIDWALELGDPPESLEPGDFVSAHGSSAPTHATGVGITIKWSPLVEGWSDLREGHRWWTDDLRSRVFQPRSVNGRWRYYRLVTARRYGPRLHFLREDEGSAPDQPTILDWLANSDAPKSFGAVLGKPVFHSRSPERHGPHFHAFEIGEEEWQDAVTFLRELGLDRAAITSPLKERAFEWASAERFELTARADRLGSINTLRWFDRIAPAVGRVGRADNTDLPGFEKVLSQLGISRDVHVVLWGGGGTAAMIRELLPQVEEYSARTGQPRHASPNDKAQDPSLGPEVVIWGVGRSVFTGRFPPERWRPKLILDLNYAEDSPGREYAQKIVIGRTTSTDQDVRYVSGLGLFEAQAALQFETSASISES